jgi:hypothetical protein
LQTRRSTPKEASFSPKTATPFLFLALTALVAGWIGCSAGSSTHGTNGTGGTSGSTGTGATTATGGAGGAGGSTTGDSGTDAPSCTAQQKICNGVCVGVDDPMYGCGPTFCTPCGLYANAGATCAGGTCTLGTCNPGYADCDHNGTNGCETNVGTDPNNCGMCGTVCMLAHATSTCTNGACTVQSCDPGGWTQCGSEVDGGVTDGGVTDGGTDGGAPSMGCTANTQTDPSNCGACGNTCVSPQSCLNGVCGLYCDPGQAPCNGVCVPLGTNQNCNFCGDTCMLANANSNCQPQGNRWVCDLITCNPGFANCDMSSNVNGCQTNTTNDPNNCDACGNQCLYGPNSTPLCSNSACVIICDPGYADCDKQPADGCEVNTNTDPGNCGGCGTTCSMNHATETCVTGNCAIVVCQSGYSDCDKNPSNGCEANTQNDPNNCGGCGVICTTANGTPACVQGMCAVGSCNPGFQHCATTGTNCETNVSNNTANCGACGNVCSTNNDTPSCGNGICSLQCNPGYANCATNTTTGCQTPINTVGNCGSCGNACTTQNGTPACNTATNPPTCAVASCATGYAACPGNGNNCLTYIGGSDVNNCGGCGTTCTTQNGTPKCTGGTCSAGSCNSGWGNCPGDGDNCSTPLNTVNNCGGCGVVCTTTNGTPACNLVGGLWTCQAASCNAGWGNCAGDGTNCSTNTNTDNNNCGGCGTLCDVATCGGAAGHVASTACTGGKCDIATCASGYDSTDTVCSDGVYCECAVSTISSTCPGGAFSLGTLPVGAAAVSNTSNLYPGTVNAAYYTVTFSGNTDVGSGLPNFTAGYHPKIVLTDISGEGFVMEVTSDCSTPISACNTAGDAASANGVTTWEVQYTAGDPNSKSPGGVNQFVAVPAVGSSGTVYVKVYRKGAVSNCSHQYTITASNI